MRKVLRYLALGLTLALLGGCIITHDDILSTSTGDKLSLEGKMQCQSYEDDGELGGKSIRNLVSLRNGVNGVDQQYLWIPQSWQKDQAAPAPITVHLINDGLYLAVQQITNKSGKADQGIEVIVVTSSTLEVLNYGAERVQNVKKDFPNLHFAYPVKDSFVMSGSKEDQRAFLYALGASAKGSKPSLRCSLVTPSR